jgi:hypothetical protein
MSYRRRHRWLRRLALGLALVWTLSFWTATIVAAKVHTGVPVLEAVRPDDRAARFAHSSAAPLPGLAGGGWTLERDEALVLVVVATVLALGLGLGLGYLRRPRLAGF